MVKAVKMEVDDAQRKRLEKMEKTKKTKKEDDAASNGVLGKRQRGKEAAKAPEKKRAKRS